MRHLGDNPFPVHPYTKESVALDHKDEEADGVVPNDLGIIQRVEILKDNAQGRVHKLESRVQSKQDAVSAHPSQIELEVGAKSNNGLEEHEEQPDRIGVLRDHVGGIFPGLPDGAIGEGCGYGRGEVLDLFGKENDILAKVQKDN